MAGLWAALAPSFSVPCSGCTWHLAQALSLGRGSQGAVSVSLTSLGLTRGAWGQVALPGRTGDITGTWASPWTGERKAERA